MAEPVFIAAAVLVTVGALACSRLCDRNGSRWQRLDLPDHVRVVTKTSQLVSGCVEMVPPDTNRGSSFAGQPIRLGGRKPTLPTCRDEVLTALAALSDRTGKQVLTVREVHAEMVAKGTTYAEVTVLKTMQRMKEEPIRPPYDRLERVGREGFQLARR